MKVIAIVAHTLDGFIARENGELINWTSPEDKELFAQETKKGGVIIIGAKTYRTLKKPLPGRLNLVLTSRSEEYQSTAEVLEFTNAKPQTIISNLKERGFQKIFVAGGGQVYSCFLREKLLDELWLTLEPLIFGQGVPNFNEKFYNINCSLLACRKLNKNSLHLRYKINYE
jgi:dihydrofolate reductase